MAETIAPPPAAGKRVEGPKRPNAFEKMRAARAKKVEALHARGKKTLVEKLLGRGARAEQRGDSAENQFRQMAAGAPETRTSPTTPSPEPGTRPGEALPPAPQGPFRPAENNPPQLPLGGENTPQGAHAPDVIPVAPTADTQVKPEDLKKVKAEQLSQMRQDRARQAEQAGLSADVAKAAGENAANLEFAEQNWSNQDLLNELSAGDAGLKKATEQVQARKDEEDHQAELQKQADALTAQAARVQQEATAAAQAKTEADKKRLEDIREERRTQEHAYDTAESAGAQTLAYLNEQAAREDLVKEKAAQRTEGMTETDAKKAIQTDANAATREMKQDRFDKRLARNDRRARKEIKFVEKTLRKRAAEGDPRAIDALKKLAYTEDIDTSNDKDLGRMLTEVRRNVVGVKSPKEWIGRRLKSVFRRGEYKKDQAERALMAAQAEVDVLTAGKLQMDKLKEKHKKKHAFRDFLLAFGLAIVSTTMDIGQDATQQQMQQQMQAQ
ncbi:MAG TPA: hypothetical protein VFQ63_00525 [Patescibacteria group bacterium]|nr:hypothetical protein [Patescibacteria group bacterium]